MAVVAGNLALLLDVVLPRAVTPDRKSFESDGEARNRVVARGKSKSKVNGVDFDEESSDEENNSNGYEEGEEEPYDWEKVMRRRVKEIEERRELEKKAEELQSRVDDGEGEGEGKEESEEQKRMRVKKELEKVAKEQAERRATAQLMFDLGQKAYGRGMYGRAIEFLEGALTIIPRSTLFGGEIQIWLAMAYEANNRHADCIALYQQLEKKHPSVSIRRQAAELRYILQAPKLKISQEEMVTIPLIGSSYDSYAATWTDKYKDKEQGSSGSTTNQLSSSRDYIGDFLVWRPPTELGNSQTFWVALTIWLGLVGAALFLQR
ncbi:Tetratricopeptide-like helical [Quillaja saponaria]|uniref:Tetratricopeptide-like helical n=1 Tax=Quillaja saponaria TaxID=32244 RepID=A0AAD7KR28_QUISA|nr:Tetratricopeptide-like helical [Quillaja saponaria]